MGNETVLSSEQKGPAAQAGAMSRAGFEAFSTGEGLVSRAGMVKPAAARAI